jgi:hypothetical protein
VHTPRTLLLTLPLLALTLVSCSDSDSSGTSVPDPSTAPDATSATLGDGHGAVSGSTEVAEPQLHLMTVDPTGGVDLLDLADEAVTAIGDVPGVTTTATDGRYLFLSSVTTGALTIIDSGMWTWDHEDHFHYYRGEPKVLGTVEGSGEAVVTPGASATGVFFPESGQALTLSNDALARGEISIRSELPGAPHAGLVIPLADFTLMTLPGPDGTAASVQVYGADGGAVDGATAGCADARGTITTPVGAVIGCEDGALLATVEGEGVAFERIPYPDAGPPRAVEFRAREGRPSVAAVAGDEGAWILDTRQQSWQFIPTEAPLLQVATVDDREGHVVALGEDGRVLVLSTEAEGIIAATGPLLAETLTDPGLLAGVELIADQQRAYLNAPAEQQLHEIDFADSARIARTFDTAAVPAHLAETGR